MFCPDSTTASYEEVLLVTKRTFIEFRHPEYDTIPLLPRSKSEPLLLSSGLTLFSKASSKFMEAATPTTCASVNGDEDDDTLSLHSESPEDQIIANVQFTRKGSDQSWADIVDCDSMSVSESSDSPDAVEVSPKVQDEERKKSKEGGRRSGRARQRESRRRRMRSPSPSKSEEC